MLSCHRTKSLLSPYIDAVISAREMYAVSSHLRACPECRDELAALQNTQRVLARAPKIAAPPDLALRIRLALSKEASSRSIRRFESLKVHFRNAVQAFMVPATAGLVSAILCFAVLMGYFAVPHQLLGADDDLPRMLYTPPELASAPFGLTLESHDPGTLIVEATIDADGRVADYRIVDQQADEWKESSDLKNALIFTTFKPAMAFGRPTSGRVVLSFAKINVRG